MDELQNYSALRGKIYDASPETRKLWVKTALKRRIASMFARMRTVKNTSQKEVAERTTWDKGYVSRLEGAQGGLPGINTLSRFAEACDLTIVLIVCEKPTHSSGEVRVIDALSLYPEPSLEDIKDGRIPNNYFVGLVGHHLPVRMEG